MSLLGTGAVAIWHDIAPEGRDEFYNWHGTEHMPERVGIPGFLRGRRYVAIEADLEFFNLYETISPGVLSGPDYLARLNDPTPWTVSTVKHFRRVSRSLCRIAATTGPGQGGLVSTWRYDVSPGNAEAHIDRVANGLLPALVADGKVAGGHLLIADTEASAIDTVERQARSEKNKVPNWVLIVEGWSDAGPFDSYCRQVLSDSVLAAAGAGPAEYGLYQLQATRDSQSPIR